MKIHVVWASVCVFIFMITAFFVHRQQDLKVENLKEKNQVLEETIKKLNQKETENSASENKAFFEALFNYSDVDKRFEDVKKLTTEKGLDYAFPSRTNERHTVSIQSELLSLESYSRKVDESRELFLNVVELATTANSVTTNQTLIVQTTLIKVKDEWLVDDVQVKGNG
ncbi:hypothetical protein ACH95_01690 [Bacillus glycinifermentans]|uniref:MerR family transcriptional regulator n=1 Tax=Bacillus glycinifermentans TaxID=1664069 RepID=A0A0J6H2W3_9BACI|nr:hypothetical protein [Bacillus glycinifermentans]ATH94151.1 hypothetical protein COP00_17325 [Bacillus glycinifermentans]KMM63383.1 hypothetical protein ACH95_01690 [Bacillus glycinifermentans]KRT95580.1 hypothetical protein AB447_200235 [Bacillus glycinifermentans]MEC0484547.1 hypothetical protein [Bacillus glycinifermentans]MEC0496564.1 hypothetical protein [Bacillus glycinifermentans]